MLSADPWKWPSDGPLIVRDLVGGVEQVIRVRRTLSCYCRRRITGLSCEWEEERGVHPVRVRLGELQSFV